MHVGPSSHASTDATVFLLRPLSMHSFHAPNLPPVRREGAFPSSRRIGTCHTLVCIRDQGKGRNLFRAKTQKETKKEKTQIVYPRHTNSHGTRQGLPRWSCRTCQVLCQLIRGRVVLHFKKKRKRANPKKASPLSAAVARALALHLFGRLLRHHIEIALPSYGCGHARQASRPHHAKHDLSRRSTRPPLRAGSAGALG